MFCTIKKIFIVLLVLTKISACAMDPDLGLLRACQIGDFDRARSLVQQGASISIQDGTGNTPFHLAAEHGEGAYGLLKFFVDEGAQTSDDRILFLANDKGVTVFNVLQSFTQEKAKKATTHSSDTIFVES